MFVNIPLTKGSHVARTRAACSTQTNGKEHAFREMGSHFCNLPHDLCRYVSPAMQEIPVQFLDQNICWRRDRLLATVFSGFPCGSAGRESACNVGDLGLIPGLERSSGGGEGKGYPLQCSGLENSMDCIVYGVAMSQTQLSDFHTFTPTLKKHCFELLTELRAAARIPGPHPRLLRWGEWLVFISICPKRIMGEGKYTLAVRS